jgi:hypothetical protein
VSGLLRNLSAQALGRSAAVRSVVRLPYAALPTMSELPGSEQAGPPPAPVASVAAPPDMAERTVRSQPGIAHGTPPLLLPRRHNDASDAPLFSHAMRAPADGEIAAPAMHPPAGSVAPAPVPPPALVPTTPHVVPPLAFVMPPLGAAAGPAVAHRTSGGGETTEVHVSIGRIELTAVQEASPPARRAPPAKPLLSLKDYLGQRQRRPS